MATGRGKWVEIEGQRRHFPALSRNPGGALDSAREEREDDDEDAADEGLARHIADAVCDALRSYRKGDSRRARDEGEEEVGEAPARSVVDRRRGARDEESDRVDHRRDFRSGSVDSALAQDTRDVSGMPRRPQTRQERRLAAECPDLREIFAASEHPHRNRA